MKKLILPVILWSIVVTSTLAETIYFTATGEQNGMPVIYRSMQTPPDGIKESTYPHLVNIYWAFDPSENNGMPNYDTNLRQFELEEALIPIEGIEHGYLMLVVTGNGRKEWIWYVKDVDSWMSQLNSQLAEHEVYPIEIEITHQPTWSTYYNFLEGVDGR